MHSRNHLSDYSEILSSPTNIAKLLALGEYSGFVLKDVCSRFIELNQLNKYNVWLKSRQLGFTTAAIIDVVQSSLTKPLKILYWSTHPGPMNKCSSVLNKLENKLDCQLIQPKQSNLLTTLVNGSEINFIRNGEVFSSFMMGKEYDLVVLDEFGYACHDIESMWDAAYKTVARNNGRIVAFTGIPSYPTTLESLWTKLGESQVVNIYTAPWWTDNTRSPTWLTTAALNMDHKAVRNEYECRF